MSLIFNMKSIPDILKSFDTLNLTHRISDRQFKDFYFKRFLYPEFWHDTEAWDVFISEHADELLHAERNSLQLGVPLVPESQMVNTIVQINLEPMLNTLQTVQKEYDPDSTRGVSVKKLKDSIQSILDTWKSIKVYIEDDEDTFAYNLQAVITELDRFGNWSSDLSINAFNTFLTFIWKGYSCIKKYIYGKEGVVCPDAITHVTQLFQNNIGRVFDEHIDLNWGGAKGTEDLMIWGFGADTFERAFLDCIVYCNSFKYKEDETFTNPDLEQHCVHTVFTMLSDGWEGIKSLEGKISNSECTDMVQSVSTDLYNNLGKYGYYLEKGTRDCIVLETPRVPKPTAYGKIPFGLKASYIKEDGLSSVSMFLQDSIKDNVLDRSVLDEYFNTYWYSVEESNRLATNYVFVELFNRIGMSIDLQVPAKEANKAADLTTYANTLMNITGIPTYNLNTGIYTKDKINNRAAPETVVRSINDLYTVKLTKPQFEPEEWDSTPIKNSNKPVLSTGIHSYLWKRECYLDWNQTQNKVSCIRLPYQKYPYHVVIATQGELVHIDINQSCSGMKLTKDAYFESRFLRTDDYIYLYFKTSTGKCTITVFGTDSDNLVLTTLDEYPDGTVAANII